MKCSVKGKDSKKNKMIKIYERNNFEIICLVLDAVFILQNIQYI